MPNCAAPCPFHFGAACLMPHVALPTLALLNRVGGRHRQAVQRHALHDWMQLLGPVHRECMHVKKLPAGQHLTRGHVHWYAQCPCMLLQLVLPPCGLSLAACCRHACRCMLLHAAAVKQNGMHCAVFALLPHMHAHYIHEQMQHTPAHLCTLTSPRAHAHHMLPTCAHAHHPCRVAAQTAPTASRPPLPALCVWRCLA